MVLRSNVPIRIGGSRSKAGCTSCKQRRVKCDETKPICLKCQRGARQCVYESSSSSTTQSERTVFKHWEVHVPGDSPVQNNFDLSYNVSPYGGRDISEVTAAKSFVLHVGKDLSGCFSDKIWCDVLPRMAQHEPCIWHAMVAISTLDSSLQLDPTQQGSTTANSTAIRHYTKAIEEVNKAIEEVNTTIQSGSSKVCQDVVLMSCVLFMIFESRQNHYESALRHVVGGLKLLNKWKTGYKLNGNDGNLGYLDQGSLEPIFLALDSQAVQLGAVPFKEAFNWQPLFEEFSTPVEFSSIQEAYVSLNHTFNRISHWCEWIEPVSAVGEMPDVEWMAQEKTRLREQLVAWDRAFEKPLSLYHPEPATHLLLMQRNAVQAMMDKCDADTSEMGWDNQNGTFREVVEHAEAYMDITSAAQAEQRKLERPAAALTVAMDIVLPLFFVCAKCRHPGLRRRALELLKRCHRREGIWDSDSCAMLAERVIAFEESHSSEEGIVSEDSRIYMIDVHIEEEMWTVEHKRLVRGGAEGDHVERFEGLLFS